MIDEPIKKGAVAPLLGLLGAVLAVSTGSIFIRLAQGEVEPLTISFYRLGIAALVLLPFAYRSRNEATALEKKEWLLLLIGGVCLSLHFVSWVSSLRYTSVISSVVIVTSAPLWVALLSPVLLKENITNGAKVGMVLALLGGLLVAASGSFQIQQGQVVWMGMEIPATSNRVWLGNLLALAGAWFAAGFLLAGRKMRPRLSLGLYTFLLYSIAAVCMLLFLLVFRQPMTGFSGKMYLWLAAMAFIPQLIGHTLLNWALGYVSAAYVSVALLGEPVGATLLALIFLKEVPGLLEVSGAVVILIGIYVVSVFENRR
jgi:drug/metabolite transporter (DMT)-like permease